MTVNKIAPQALIRLASGELAGAARSPSPSLGSRVIARLFAARLDQVVDACAPVRPGSAAAVHIARLTSAAERQQLAASLRSVVRDANAPPAGLSARVAVHRDRVIAASALIDTVIITLSSPLPVRARGVARVRLLLTDGSGPLYASGSGSLGAALRGIFAAL
jgi:hypothetical protein